MPHLTLTPREIQILQLIKLGYRDRETGAKLGITQQSVKNRFTYIASKLGAVNRVDAVVKAIRLGYLSLWEEGMTDEQILNYWRAHWEHAFDDDVTQSPDAGEEEG